MVERKEREFHLEDIDLEQRSLDQAIEYLQDFKDTYIHNYGDRLRILEFEESDWGGDYKVLRLYGTRMETEEEAKQREHLEHRREEKNKAWELKEYKRLKKKYEKD